MADEMSDGFAIAEEVVKKSVSCKNIPEAFVDKKSVCIKHFAQFGPIHSFTLSPKRRACTVEYETESAAEIALIDGGFYNGEVFDIFFTRKVSAMPKPMIDYIDPDVQDELSAMAPRKMSYSKPFEVMEAPTVKSIMLPKTESKRNPRIKGTFDFGNRPLTKISMPVKPVDQNAKNELEALLKKPAFTSEEKYRVLDARDKLIRLTTSRSTDINTAITIQGVCPDMCPEKERLMREATNRVSSYELEDNSKNVMKHSSALKQYARSSADQESALPHELRPEKILKMTMDYLLHNVVDLCDSTDGNVGDWFHFVWDRTRSIRKDISQQELCSQTAVSLVEQCARFHIHCAARLIAEEAQVFDQKINSENLTKCLQSLKYLYHDLNLRREQCQNEAEFRAYVVLLNLNDCQFFWDVKQFPHHILHSKEIRFAINVYLAMANNNYVKFFKLVRQTTYMNACILLRYFNQVRVGALNTIVKSYVAKYPVSMNISYWNYVLAFEDYEQTTQFFEYYGMQCDREDDRILLDRNSLYYPNLPFILDRAINVVEHKRVCSVGEAIHGGPLGKFDDFSKYVPHDSFDENGLLYADAWTAEDQNYLNPPTPKRRSAHTPFRDEDSVFKIPQAPQQKTSPNPKPSIFAKLSPRQSQSDSKSIFANITGNSTATLDGPKSTLDSSSSNVFGKSLFGDSISSKNIFQLPTNKTSERKMFDNHLSTNESSINPPSSKSASKSLFSVTNNTPSTIFGGSSGASNIFANFSQNSDSATSNTFSKDPRLMAEKMEYDLELQELESEKRKIEMEIQKENEAAERLKKEEEEKVRQELKNKKEKKKKMEWEKYEKEKSEKIEADALKRLKQIEDMSEKSAQELINAYVDEALKEIAKNELKYYQQIEKATREIYHELLTELIFDESSDFERLRQEKIEKIENTPIWMPDKPLPELVPDLMHPLQDVTLNMKKRYLDGMPNNVTFPVIHEKLVDIFEIVPYQLQKTRSATEFRIPKKPTFWKCGISIPDLSEDKACHRIEKWLNKMFVRREQPDSKWFFCEQQFVQSIQQDVAICLRQFSGSKLINEEGLTDINDTTGVNAIIFLMSAANPQDTKKRLSKVLEHRTADCAIGIVMLTIDNVRESLLRSELEIDHLISTSDSPIEYFYHHLTEGSLPLTSIRNKLIKKCLKFVASNCNFKSSLEMQSTISFFNLCLGNLFWHRISRSSTLNPGLFKAATKINIIIDVYNTALDILDNIINEDFSSHPIFPHEFKRFVKPISVDIPKEYQYFPDDWKNPNRSRQLRNFLTSLKLQPVLLTFTTIEDIQQQLFNYAQCHITDEACSIRAATRMIKNLLEHMGTNEEQTFQHQINSFNWIDAIRLLSLEIFNYIFLKSAREIPSEVIYDRDELKRYLVDPWWLMDSGPLPKVQLMFKESDEEDEATIAKKPRLVSINKDELEELMARSATCLEQADKKIDKFKKVVKTGREITHELDVMLYNHERNLRVQNGCLHIHKEN